MQRSFERRIDSVDQRLVLLAPAGAVVPGYFQNVTIDPDRRERQIREMQRLRGEIYLRDGAVHAHELSAEGLHQTPEDAKSWHLLMYKEGRRLSSTMWYMEHHSPTFEQLRVCTCPLRNVPEWRDLLSRAVEVEIARARDEHLHYAEIGGWAVAAESRCTTEGLVLALAAYSLGRIFGGSLGMTNATVRHASSTILKQIGGSPLEADGVTIPPYFDPRYGCQMELLRFDSRRPNSRFGVLIELLRKKLSDVVVVAAEAATLSEPTYVGVTRPLGAQCA